MWRTDQPARCAARPPAAAQPFLPQGQRPGVQSPRMKVAVGSTRPTKVEAVKEAWQVFGAQLLKDPDEPVEFLAYDVAGEGPAVPVSLPDLMKATLTGVESLILQLKRERAEADFYVALEGGFNVVNSHGPRRLVFLESWVYVSDGHQGSFGHGGGIAVPPAIANPVIDRGIELGIVLDRFSQETGIGNRQGTWGLLTRDILTRKHSYVIALIAAFAPFYNPEAYG